MRQRFLGKFTCFLMVVVLMTMSVTGFCQDSHDPEMSANSHQSECDSYVSGANQSCPCCPADEHSVPSHCDSACNCPCHAPLTSTEIRIVCSRDISPLVFNEPFIAIPEVYLPKFIPPHIHA